MIAKYLNNDTIKDKSITKDKLSEELMNDLTDVVFTISDFKIGSRKLRNLYYTVDDAETAYNKAISGMAVLVAGTDLGKQRVYSLSSISGNNLTFTTVYKENGNNYIHHITVTYDGENGFTFDESAEAQVIPPSPVTFTVTANKEATSGYTVAHDASSNADAWNAIKGNHAVMVYSDTFLNLSYYNESGNRNEAAFVNSYFESDTLEVVSINILYSESDGFSVSALSSGTATLNTDTSTE